MKSAVGSALPNGIAIFICCVLLIEVSKFAGIDSAQCSLLMYLTVGFVSLAGVIKASLPFNKLRGFLSAASVVGFLCAVILFSGLLQLPGLSVIGAFILPVILTLGIILAVYIKIPVYKNL